MCSSKAKVTSTGIKITTTTIGAQIGGRPVLQPTCNRIHHLEARNSLRKKGPPPPPPPPPPISNITTSRTKHSNPVPSPPLRSPRPQAIKRGNDVNGLNTSSEKVTTPRKNLTTTTTTTTISTLERKKSKKTNAGIAAAGACNEVPAASTVPSLSRSYSSSSIIDAPGSIAAVRREQMALLQAQRKMKIAHYGRSKSAKFDAKVVPCTSSSDDSSSTNAVQQKRCSFITPNSDPIYVAYHDEEWGVPVREDNMLFELLVLSGAQFGSDWTSILKKRQEFRNAFSGFDPESVAKFNEKKILSVSSDYGIELSKVRGIADNSNRILEIKREFGSFERYIWGFVNHKTISTKYGSCQKIPVKTSKSESISKDMVRRGFRFVGPTIVHSFMQASGLTNDHLITCHRHFLPTN